jgi:hypothetical protein
MSATGGTLPASGNGRDGSTPNCTPWIVSFVARMVGVLEAYRYWSPE